MTGTTSHAAHRSHSDAVVAPGRATGAPPLGRPIGRVQEVVQAVFKNRAARLLVAA